MNRVNGGIIEGIENREIIVKSTWIGISDISSSEENEVIITPPEDRIFEKTKSRLRVKSSCNGRGVGSNKVGSDMK